MGSNLEAFQIMDLSITNMLSTDTSSFKHQLEFVPIFLLNTDRTENCNIEQVFLISNYSHTLPVLKPDRQYYNKISLKPFFMFPVL